MTLNHHYSLSHSIPTRTHIQSKQNPGLLVDTSLWSKHTGDAPKRSSRSSLDIQVDPPTPHVTKSKGPSKSQRKAELRLQEIDKEEARIRFGLADIQVESEGIMDRPTRSPAASIPLPSASRNRAPPPPSPLSQINSPSSDAETREPPSPGQNLAAPTLSEPLTSPCYIHSYLDKHGSGTLADYLNHPSASQPRRQSLPNGHAHGIQQHQVKHSPRRGARVPDHVAEKKQREMRSPTASSGYDTDQSSNETSRTLPRQGSGLFDADYDEDGGSLTRQLAETAQGVREMSRELGRTAIRSRVQSVLIVTKARDNRLIKLTRELAVYLMSRKSAGSTSTSQNDRGLIVYVDHQLRTSKRFDAAGIQKEHPEFFRPTIRRRSSSSASISTLSAAPSTTSLGEFHRKRNGDEGQLRYWTGEMCSTSPHLFDFVITLGGDGTVLFTSWLFQKIVPPVLPFALGSLGFLTNFDFASYKQTMDRVIDDGIRVNLRMRFTCTVYRAIAPDDAESDGCQITRARRKAIKKPGGEILMSQVDKAGWEALEGGTPQTTATRRAAGRDKEIMCFSTRPVEQFEVLNDLVVDRGPSPYVSLLEIFGDEHHLTTVQADGLTVSTPTGSTAYSLSAGGSLVHPQIPAILITPICPHTLSFRPMLLPDGMELRICVPYNSRSTAWASFDGRGRVELKQGDHIKVTASKYPFPTVCADKASTDWFKSVSRTLRWNEREKQKSFVVVEEEDGHASREHPVHGTKQPDLGHKRREESKKKAEAGNDDPHGVEAQRDLTGEIDDADEEEEEEFDIDDKSGQATPSSPLSPSINDPRAHSIDTQIDAHPSHPSARSIKSAKSGVDTPDRFVTHYSGPPPLSGRHLVEKLAQAELKEKENERGQRDDIREDPGALRYEGVRVDGRGRGRAEYVNGHGHGHGHSHGHGRDSVRDADRDERTPRPRGDSAGTGAGAGGASRTAARAQSREGRAKAFAFFGQDDDSASDMSDDLQEP